MKKLFAIAVSALLIQGCDRVGDTDNEFYGIVESRPAETAGTWVIGGRSVTATADTELDEDHGSPFAVGTCVEVEMEDDLVEEIESKPPSKCKSDDEFYGIVESRPAGTAGTWVIGGSSVTATDKTKLDDDHGASFAVGTCVEVEMEDDLVEEIESKSPSKCK